MFSRINKGSNNLYRTEIFSYQYRFNGNTVKKTRISGKNEGDEHFNTKLHLYNELKRLKRSRKLHSLRLEIPCLHVGKFWTCPKIKHVSWEKNWSDVSMEYNVPDVGVVDVALVAPNYKLSAEPSIKKRELKKDEYKIAEDQLPKINEYKQKFQPKIEEFLNNVKKSSISFQKLDNLQRKAIHMLCDEYGLTHKSEGLSTRRVLNVEKKLHHKKLSIQGLNVIEVFHSSAMTKDKIDRLQEAGVPWVEVKAKRDFYSPGPKQWTVEQPLRIVASSEQYITYVDENGKTKSKRWKCTECEGGLQNQLIFSRLVGIFDYYYSSCHMRKFYFLLEKPSMTELDSESFTLVEGGYLSYEENAYSFYYPNYCLYTEKSSSFHTKCKLKEAFQSRINHFDQLYPNSIKDIRLDWPGKSVKTDFANDEVLSVRKIDTPADLIPSLSRLFPLRYSYSLMEKAWVTPDQLYSKDVWR